MEFETKSMHANGTHYIKVPPVLAKKWKLNIKPTKLMLEYDEYVDPDKFEIRRERE